LTQAGKANWEERRIPVMRRLSLVGIAALIFLLSMQAVAQQTESTKKVTITVSGMT
jgi:hypothetical protein